MALFGKFNKDDLVSKAKNAVDGIKTSIEQKQAEKEAYEAEM